MANYQQWSQSYFTNLTLDQHIVNNNWFMNTLTMLKPDGTLYVPCLDKSFNKLGKEVNNDLDKFEDKVNTHKLQPLAYYDYRVDVNNIVK